MWWIDKNDTEWSKASQKPKKESTELSRYKSCAKGIPSLDCKTIHMSDSILSN